MRHISFIIMLLLFPVDRASAQITNANDWQHIGGVDACPVLAVGVNYPLSEHWRLNTGFEYAFCQGMEFSSDYDNDYHKSMTRGTSYIGIPFRIQYLLVSKPSYTFYASAGITAEKCVKNKEDYEYSMGNGNPYTSGYTDGTAWYRYIVSGSQKPFQFSLNIGAGMQANLRSNFGLFLHIETGYFLPDGSSVQNFYTERHPPVKVQFGFFFNINPKHKQH